MQSAARHGTKQQDSICPSKQSKHTDSQKPAKHAAPQHPSTILYQRFTHLWLSWLPIPISLRIQAINMTSWCLSYLQLQQTTYPSTTSTGATTAADHRWRHLLQPVTCRFTGIWS